MKDCDDVLIKKTFRLRPETLERYEALAASCGMKFSVFMRTLLEDRLDRETIARLSEQRRRA